MAVTQYAFFVDSDACSGCKTCQVACKDKNDLPAGVHWRKVIEVTAGGWQRRGAAWAPEVVAYHLSVACHHCVTPVCARMCTPEAIWKRTDGVVLIDNLRCTRCRKCESDCPYGAIRYDAAAHQVGKCDFCADLLDAGQPPACVAACPNRALDFGEYAEIRSRHGETREVFPLPSPSIADPSLAIRPHRHARLARERGPEVANWEEI